MRTRLIATTLLLATLSAPAAHAHAFLDHASPLVGGTAAAAPHEVTLWFTQNIEPAFSRIEVSDSSGARVDQGKAQVSGSTMRVGLKPLAAGTYRVHWHVLSVDTHTTQGSFTFRVGGR
jgi:methionine-rich copper-binding protein CopC